MRMSTLVLAVLTSLLLAPIAAAADEDLERAREKIERGGYRSAAGVLDELLDEEPDHAEARVLRGRLRLETGRYADAEADLRRARGVEATASRAGELLVEVLVATGRADEALALTDEMLKADPGAVRARLLRGRLLRLRGRRAEARTELRSLLTRYNKDPFTAVRDRLDVAKATIELAELAEDADVDLSPTMRLLDRLTRDEPDLVAAYVVKGDLLVKWQRDVDARKEYKQALRVNSRHVEALRGMAESYAFRGNQGEARRHIEKALRVSPNHEALLCWHAGVKIGDYEFDEGRALLRRVLEQNPQSGEARALLGAAAFVTGDLDEFEKQRKAALAFDPTDGRFFHVLASILESHRRFEEAATWARKALETDPRNWGAAFTLGRNLLNVGEEEEAFEILDKAERLDPYPHIWRKNYLELFDAALSKFVETRTKHFRLRIHVSESRVFRDLLGEFMEESYRVLGDKYGHHPRPPVLIEVFHVHADFAARTVGMPGLGALGACFGRVITLDSPSARDPGTFAWAATAWHEFAHSVTLGLSHGRVPRWFTEGLSVYEELQHSGHWSRRMERQMFDAHRNDDLPEVAKFNSWFRGPRVGFAYFLGGVMCEHIVEMHGFEKIPEMLKLYGEDRRDEDVFRTALGISTEEFDARFRTWLGERMKDWKLRPRWSTESLSKFRRAARANPQDFDVQMSLAEAFLQRGNAVDAGVALGRARKLRPEDPRVLALLGHLARAKRVPAKAREFYEKSLARPNGEDFDVRFALATILRDAGELEAAVASFEQAKRNFPYAVGAQNPFAELARIHDAAGNVEAALAAKRELAALVETEIPARLDLAAWANEQGRFDEECRWLEEVVLIYPLSGDVNARYARALKATKRWDRSALLYRMTLALDPEEGVADLHAELAEVEHMRGEERAAREEAEKALEIEPEHEGAKAVLERISGS
jgi:tetratricopeptide (TPR) repeat protein